MHLVIHSSHTAEQFLICLNDNVETLLVPHVASRPHKKNTRLIVYLTRLLVSSQSVFWAHSVAEDMTTLEGNFRQQNKSCFILGASGETGKLLLQELLERNIFSRITLIGRRQLTFEDKAYENLVSEMGFFFFQTVDSIT